MNYAYIRQMPHFAPLFQQQQDILAFAMAHHLDIEKEVVEYSNKNLSLDERKDFERFMQSISKADRLIVSSFAVISDKVEEVVKVINCILSHEATLYVCASQTRIDSEAKLIDVAPLLNDLRKAQEKRQVRIGRPKGSRSSSKFDVYHARIIEMLREGMNVSAIARALGVSRSSLKDYIESRGLKELTSGSWLRELPVSQGMENVVLICPFEETAAQGNNQEKTEEKVS
jgi:DNA invertase Pin-like site-specific DNA recombinase